MDIKKISGPFLNQLVLNNSPGEFSARDFESMAEERSAESSRLLEEKAVESAQTLNVFDEIKHSLRLSFDSWLWAANVYASKGDQKNFEKAISNASAEACKHVSHTDFEAPEYIEERRQAMKLLSAEKEALYTHVMECQARGTPKSYMLISERPIVKYDDATRQEFLCEAVIHLHMNSKRIMPDKRFNVPPGGRRKEIGSRSDEINNSLAGLELEREKPWHKRRSMYKINSDMVDLIKEQNKLGNEASSIPLEDDVEVAENYDGKITFSIGDYTFQFFDIKMPGNKMIFEARRWKAEKASANPGQPKVLSAGIDPGLCINDDDGLRYYVPRGYIITKVQEIRNDVLEM